MITFNTTSVGSPEFFREGCCCLLVKPFRKELAGMFPVFLILTYYPTNKLLSQTKSTSTEAKETSVSLSFQL